MGVWDIAHLTHQYKKWLKLALNEDLPEKDRAKYWINAGNARRGLEKYLARYGTHLQKIEEEFDGQRSE